MLQIEPEIVAHYVANGTVSLSFGHVLDHGNPSVLAHSASECAGNQDALGFWRMHDLLFERQNQLWTADADQMAAWATELGLDGEQMRTCLADGAATAKVQHLDQARRDAGIRLRPTFELNGELIQGSVPFTVFAERIEQALN